MSGDMMLVLGTINNRIEVGYNKITGHIFVHGSSNCMQFSHEEVDSLLAVLTVANMLPLQSAGELLKKKYVPLWEPKL